MLSKNSSKNIDPITAKESNSKISHAQSSQKIKNDYNRPAFHFLPPANWINDPNGLIYFEGYYHLFYQHNPYADSWGSIHWGHARSKDLVHWEHLPIALSPSLERGEDHCYSGCGFIRNDNHPILFYTSIGKREPEQWAAIPINNELRDWQKLKENPILRMEDHNGQEIEDWRDPFIFKEADHIYMVIGGHPKNESGSVMIYKALNYRLSNWKYLGILFQDMDKNWECPNLFELDDKYVLLYTPHGTVKFFIGKLELEKIKFTPEFNGVIDYGPTIDYYAPHTLQLDNGKRITIGWIKGFKSKQGWHGTLSLPRELSLDKKGRLLQKPIPELERLRSNRTILKNFQLRNSQKIKEVTCPQFELHVSFGKAGTPFIGFRFDDESGKPYEIKISPLKLSFGKDRINIESSLCDHIFYVQLFFDRTIVEIFVNDGLLCATKVIYPDKNNFSFEIFFNKSNVEIEFIKLWQMKSIW